MGQSTDELRRDIENVRGDLTVTVDAIGDRLSPKQIVRRRTSRMRDGMTRIRETVMGTTTDGATGTGQRMATGTSHPGDTLSSGMSSAGERVSDMASTASDKVSDAASTVAEQTREAPQEVRRATQGNPIAAGIIAFGSGLLLASLFPATEPERQAASAVQDRLEPLKERATETGRELAGDLKQSAQGAVQEVKGTATDAAQDVAGQAKGAAGEVRDDAKSAARDVKQQTQR
ncbi:MAG TPA: DUF3618 domain-containing protein [Acidimicrobiia bacterium]|nr:DUF3618 domain-containing protein [Acidimicrobiia bacterium]